MAKGAMGKLTVDQARQRVRELRAQIRRAKRARRYDEVPGLARQILDLMVVVVSAEMDPDAPPDSGGSC